MPTSGRVLLTVAALACTCFAQDKPNFSGTWKLDLGRSDFGPSHYPFAQTDVIEQSGQTIRISIAFDAKEEKRQYTVTLVANGKEIDAPEDVREEGVTLQTDSTSWDGNVLVVHHKETYRSDTVTSVSRYTLSPDGRLLTVTQDVSAQNRNVSRTLVFDRADSATPSTVDSPGASMSSGLKEKSGVMPARSDDACDVHPAQPKCRRQEAQLIEDNFRKSKFDIKVTLADPDDRSIVFTSRATLGNKQKRASFYSKFVGSDFEESLCKSGFERLTLNGANNGEGYDISCRETPKPCPPSAATESANTLGTGHIRGTLTYYFNSNYGSRPDVGSQIWLMRGYIEISSGAFFFGYPDQIVVDKARYCSVAHTIADGNGVFELGEVQPGDYTLLIQSNHTKGTPGFGTAAVTMRDIGGRVVTFPISLSPGQTIDKSWDFGVSTF